MIMSNKSVSRKSITARRAFSAAATGVCAKFLDITSKLVDLVGSNPLKESFVALSNKVDPAKLFGPAAQNDIYSKAVKTIKQAPEAVGKVIRGRVQPALAPSG